MPSKAPPPPPPRAPVWESEYNDEEQEMSMRPPLTPPRPPNSDIPPPITPRSSSRAQVPPEESSSNYGVHNSSQAGSERPPPLPKPYKPPAPPKPTFPAPVPRTSNMQVNNSADEDEEEEEDLKLNEPARTYIPLEPKYQENDSDISSPFNVKYYKPSFGGKLDPNTLGAPPPAIQQKIRGEKESKPTIYASKSHQFEFEHTEKNELKTVDTRREGMSFFAYVSASEERQESFTSGKRTFTVKRKTQLEFLIFTSPILFSFSFSAKKKENNLSQPKKGFTRRNYFDLYFHITPLGLISPSWMGWKNLYTKSLLMATLSLTMSSTYLMK